MKGLQLVVADAQAARQELLDRGVDASESSCSARTTAARSSASRPRRQHVGVQEIKARAASPLIRMRRKRATGRRPTERSWSLDERVAARCRDHGPRLRSRRSSRAREHSERRRQAGVHTLPGLNAASGAQWVRAIAYSTPPNVVYAGLEGGGVFKSTNGGATWSAFNSGFPNPLITNVRALLTPVRARRCSPAPTRGCSSRRAARGSRTRRAPRTTRPSRRSSTSPCSRSSASPAGSVMLAGVFSGGVYKSSDGGDTWSPPPANSGMPASETIYGLTENVPGLVYATAAAASTCRPTRAPRGRCKSDGIPGSASPITTWVYPQRPQILFTSTGSNGIYRSLNGGLPGHRSTTAWAPCAPAAFRSSPRRRAPTSTRPPRTGSGRRCRRTRSPRRRPAGTRSPRRACTRPSPSQQRDHVGAHHAGDPGRRRARADRRHAVQRRLLHLVRAAGQRVPGDAHHQHDQQLPAHHRHHADEVGKTLALTNRQWTGTADHRVRLPVAEVHFGDERHRARTSRTPRNELHRAGERPTARYRVEVTATNPAPTFGLVQRYSTITSTTAANPANFPGNVQTDSPTISVSPPARPDLTDDRQPRCTPSSATDPPIRATAGSTLRPPPATFQWLRCDGSGSDCNEIPGATSRTYTLAAGRRHA